MGIKLALRRDAGGEPLVSATFVLVHAPAPDERLGPLVDRAVLALDLAVEADGGGVPAAAAVTFSLLDHGAAPTPGPEPELAPGPADGAGPGAAGAGIGAAGAGIGAAGAGPATLASQRVTGPFGHGALSATLDGGAAAALLEALVGSSDRFELAAAVETAHTVSETATVQVRLGLLWSHLDKAADESRLFTRVDLANYLPGLLSAGAVVAGGHSAGGPVLDAVLKLARFVLEPVAPAGGPVPGSAAGPSPDSGPLYRLASQSPGNMDVQTRLDTVAPVDGVLAATVNLAELVNPAIAHDRARFLHLVSSGGGRLDAVLPARTTRAARGPGAATLGFIATGNRILSVGAALGSTRPAMATALLNHAVVAAQPLTHHLADLELVDTTGLQRPGPVANNGAAGIWKDRWNDVFWYAPEYVLVLPDPAAPAEQSPFTFDVEPAGGHALDGSTGITATITVALRPQRSAATVAEWEAAGKPELRAVSLTGFTLSLGIPFRDEHGATQSEQVTADSFEVQPGDGGLLTARFRLLDNWARLAYGALSVPDFQAQPAFVSVIAGFEGWRLSLGTGPIIFGLDKTLSLSGTSAATRAAPLQLHGTLLANASVHPPWQLNAEIIAQWWRNSYSWSQFASVRSTPISVPCAEYGILYREATGTGLAAIGCRPALQLGQTEYRTYQEITVNAAAGRAKVYRSLRSPGRFLVVPLRYCVGRYGPDHPDRAYRPRLLLHSTIDVDNPTNIRCVLAACLEPDLPPFVRSAIGAELKSVAAAPVLEYLPDTGAEPELRWASPSDSTINAVPTATGFDVVISTDIAGFLVLKSLLERDGLRGSVSAVLPGSVRIGSALEIGLASVAGPFQAGPIEATGRPDGKFELSNRTGQRLAVTGLAVAGVQTSTLSSMLEPQASVTVDGPAAGGFDVMYEADQSAEKLDEIRAYIEDLDLGITFVAVDDPASAGLAGWEIQTSMLGRPDPAPLLLSSGVREAERRYVLPLTDFAGDPQLQYTVVAIGTDGTRTAAAPVSWPVRSQGVLIPIRRPV
ncbi:hypothetical protein ACQCSX_19280 [Pseudarthrobacter sp. P1]|uniref:hypothetical protein n=1 Tax=Pseudarthrobacter sp. P1 TaxID=3418418 RepID=UPI003CF0D92D